MIFTTSWDDANLLDFKLIDTFCSINQRIKGTIYVPLQSKYRNTSDDEIIRLSNFFEIGCHTVNHPDLSRCDTQEIVCQLRNSKDYLSKLLNKEVKSFCFPFGRYSNESVEIAQKYFQLGRIVSPNFSLGIFEDNFLLHTSMQVCSHSKEITAMLNSANFNQGSISNIVMPKINKLNFYSKDIYKWSDIAKVIFSTIKDMNGVFHLWGHSWEIEKQNLWYELKVFLDFVALQEDIEFLDNSELYNRFINE